MKTQTKYKLVCEKCGADLDAEFTDEYSRIFKGYGTEHVVDITIEVKPCADCLEKAREEDTD